MSIVWTMEQDYCDNCGAYLYEGGLCDDNSGLCSMCFELWIEDEWEEDQWEWEHEQD